MHVTKKVSYSGITRTCLATASTSAISSTSASALTFTLMTTFSQCLTILGYPMDNKMSRVTATPSGRSRRLGRSWVTTPESHGDSFTKISQAARQRVQEADPNSTQEADSNGKLCFVQNMVVVEVDFCHCIARKYMKDKDMVCVYKVALIWASNTYYSLNKYHSSIPLNGPGIWNIALCIWTRVSISLWVGTLGSVISQLRNCAFNSQSYSQSCIW